MEQRHVWCFQCDAISVCESLFNEPEAENRRLHAIEHWKNEIARNGSDAHVAKQQLEFIEEENLRRALFTAHRNRPQYCLKCDSTDLFLPERDTSDMPHPVCGGTLKCRVLGFEGALRYPSRFHDYDVQGRLLSQGEYELWSDPNAYLERHLDEVKNAVRYDRLCLPRSATKSFLRAHRVRPPERTHSKSWIVYKFGVGTFIEYERWEKTYTVCESGTRTIYHDFAALVAAFKDLHDH